MRCHALSTTRKLNRHWQSGEEGETVRIIVKENRFAPTFPGEYSNNGWSLRSGLQGYSQQYIDGVLRDGWLWEHSAVVTRYGIGYPFGSATEQDFKDSHDRIARPYARMPWTGFYTSDLHMWLLVQSQYYENREARTNGLQPFKLTVSSEQYKPTRFMTLKESADVNILDVKFSDPEETYYNDDITKIKNFFAQCKRLNPTTPVWEYDSTTEQWSRRENTGGRTPQSLTLGEYLYFYATDDSRITPQHGLYFTITNGNVVLPEVEVTM